ncbi:class I SAM-dependent methyltransferase [Sorangium sp. So ce117]|uniref:class I SAM-dependent methyltransferase n=1 Tax=Sorangium sp. So ce117 TaxID=3133277 RepID=UPI003F647EE9
MGSPADTLRKYDAVESALTAPVSERMLDLANLRSGMRLIDLASGCGEPALRAAHRVGVHGSVLGVDVSEALLAYAREKAQRSALSNLELRLANAESLDGLPGEAFDAATARWGLMYMRAPAKALINVRRVLRQGAPFVAAFWAEPERVPWAVLARGVLARYRDVPSINPEVPGPFRYSNLSFIERDLNHARFTLEHVEEIDVPVIEAPTGAGIVKWVRDFGLTPLAAELPESEHARYESDLAREAEQLCLNGVIRLGGITRLVVAR